ncbi:hypothetical protein VPH49_21735 [Pseudomonas luteola]|uniref:gp33 family protein n=1 Tax=Pseudomonas luteola TaxID=47886 RepID=UPI003A88DD83
MNAPVNTAQTLDVLAAQRDELNMQKRALENQIKLLNGALEDNEQAILALAKNMGLDRFAVGKLTFSVSRQIVGNVKDWESVFAYIKENDAFYLVQRRLSNASYKELLDAGTTVPGVEQFEKVALNMRKLA